MKRLVDHRYLADAQHAELRALLEKAGVPFHETPTHLFSFGAIWVPDEAFERARDLLRTQSSSYAARAREAWEREWEAEHRGSALRWYLNQVALDPAGAIGRTILLVLALAIFVGWPLWFVVRG